MYKNSNTPRHTKFVAYKLYQMFVIAIGVHIHAGNHQWSVTFFHMWISGPRSKHLLKLVKPIHSALVKVLYIQL